MTWKSWSGDREAVLRECATQIPHFVRGPREAMDEDDTDIVISVEIERLRWPHASGVSHRRTH
jgi:hypothetical protein